MRSKKWKEKEFSTETLTQVEVDEIMAGSSEYEQGKAPVSRNTQCAEDLGDIAELQKDRHNRNELSKTHNFSESGETEYYDGEDSDFYEELGDGQYLEESHPTSHFTLQPITPEDEDYEDIMENYEEVMEKMSSNPTKPKYWFKEKGDHWYCTCGQLNQGDTCSNCGIERDLLRALFFLHEPGEEPGKYEGMNIAYTDVDVNGRRLSSKVKLIIAIAIIAILLIAAGIFSYYYVIKPSMEKEAAANAAAAADSLHANVVLCASNIDTFMLDSYISAGDQCYKDKKYETAIKFYGMAGKIKDSDGLQDKINSAKYGYVTENKSKGGEKFEKYLLELYKIDYSDIDKIYDEYYAWHFKIISNTSPDDDTNDISTVSRADTVYFHVLVSGGAPDETIDVYYEATWPGGYKDTYQIGTGWKAGSKGTARMAYPVPILGKEGNLVFKIYDKSTQELLGSDTVTFKH